MRTKKGKIEINNIDADHERYVVARLDEGGLWFYGSWDNRKFADNVARQMDNAVVVDMGEPDNIANAIQRQTIEDAIAEIRFCRDKLVGDSIAEQHEKQGIDRVLIVLNKHIKGIDDANH